MSFRSLGKNGKRGDTGAIVYVGVDSAMEKVGAAIQGISGDDGKAIIARALNRSVDTGKNAAIKASRETYTARRKDIAETVKVSRASPKKLQAHIVSKGSGIPLGSFKARPSTPNGRRRKPIDVQVRAGMGDRIPGFIARVGGKNGVWARRSVIDKSGNPRKYHYRDQKGRVREEIRQLYGPSAPQMLGSDDVSEAVRDESIKAFDKRLEHEISRYLDGAK